MAETTADVVVVGAGIAGAAAARWLSPDHDVLVLDRGPVAGGATGHASGLVSIAADYEAQPAFAGFALDFFGSYDGSEAFAYHRRPNVGLVAPEGESRNRDRADRLRAAGLDVAYVAAPALEDRFPGVFRLDGFAGGIVYPGGWVDPYTLCQSYLEEAQANGARIGTNVTVEGLRTDGDAVVGVRTDGGPVTADSVVVAAGWRTRDLVGPAVALPLRPFRYQTVNLAVERDLGPDYPIAWEHATRLYWRAEPNGELHVGGGTYTTDGRERRTAVTASFRDLVAAALPGVLNGLGEARIVGEGCCPTGDAATPDAYPIIDSPAEGPDGLVVATGLTGFGIMASPVVGRAVRSLVTGESAPFGFDPLRLDRFADRGTDFTVQHAVEDPAELAP